MTTSLGARLLIVDDEAALMQALCNILRQQGYATTGCSGADEALALLKEERFDLLLTDLMMPVTDGLSLVASALAIDPHLVAVMMTGEGTIATAVEAMQVGVLDYVLKPFKLGAMLPVLERALAIGQLRRENAVLQLRVQERTLELETANRELEAYAATVSHDLRAPLRGIEGLTQLLAQRMSALPTQESRPLLDMIGASVQRAQRLIDDLLRLSRTGRLPLQYARVDVSALAVEVANELQGESPSPAIAIVVDAALPAVVADPALLRQALVNLLGNAFKFSRRAHLPQVEVGGRDGVDGYAYFVRDNGVGFDMASADRLFMPFERLQGAQDYEGSGVGLSIVQRIVQRHGGRIRAESEPGRGACFYFTLGVPTSTGAAPAP